jgi:peptidoglycan/xylan/chitin deacetylase (PgdA/CDA1 family)
MALAWSGAPALVRRARLGQSIVLAYHNIVPDGYPPAGDASLHLPRADFAAQLAFLSRRCRVVELGEVLQSRPSNTPSVAITFDDGYRGALRFGVEELVKRGLPATFFVAPSLLGDRSLWWDELATSEDSGLQPRVREHALERLAGDSAEILNWAQEVSLSRNTLDSNWRTVTLEELQAAASHPGISVGSHGWSHRNLARLKDNEVRQELESSRSWVHSQFASAIPWLSYPYGFSSDRVEAAARRAGYEGAVRVNGGWIAAHGVDSFRLPRLNVPRGLSRAGLALRMAGLFAK